MQRGAIFENENQIEQTKNRNKTVIKLAKAPIFCGYFAIWEIRDAVKSRGVFLNNYLLYT